MSGLIAGAQPTSNPGDQDLRLLRPNMREIGSICIDAPDAIATGSFASEWWPRGELMSDDPKWPDRVMWSPFDPAAGAGSAFGFVGVTRDQFGSPIGGATVKLFRTSDDVKIDEVVSDAFGNFTLRTAFYPQTHYWVAFKAGTPNVQGVSSPTLIGA